MSAAIRLMAEPVRELGFAALGLVYSSIGTPMTKPIRMLVLINTTNTAVMLSLDGVTDHLPMVPNGYLVIDIAANKTSAQGFFLAENQQLFVKRIGAAPAAGSFYVSVFYGADQ